MIHQFERTVNKLIEFGLFTDKEIVESQEFFLYTEKKDAESDYNKFITEFNRITGKRYSGDVKSRELFYKAEFNYSFEELIQCTENAMKNPYFINDRPDIVKPEWILKKENLAEYLNYSAPKTLKSKTHDNSSNGKQFDKI